MGLEIKPFGYITLSESVNQIQTPNKFLTTLIFGKKRISTVTKTIQIDVITGKRKIAPFVQRGMPAKVVEQSGKKTMLVEPGNVRMKKFLTPSDLLFDRAPGSSMYIIGGQNEDAIANARMEKIALEQQELKSRNDRTIEFMAAQALSFGKISIDQPDVQFEIDFNLAAENKPKLAAAAKWDKADTCTPINDINAWKLVVKKATGKVLDTVVMTSECWDKFVASKQVQEYLNKLKINLGSIETETAVLNMGAEKMAKINNVTYYVYDEYYEDKDGNAQSMIPVNGVIGVASSADFRTYFGAIEDLDAGVVKGELFSKDWVEKDPSGLNMVVESHPLVAICEPGAVISAQVF